MKFITAIVVSLMVGSAFAQTKKAEVFSAEAIKGKLAVLEKAAAVSGSSGEKLGEYESHSIGLSVRSRSGGAEVHAHYDDIFFVTQGKATLITGGTVVNAKTDADGETRGDRLQDGQAQSISAGDVVHIPSGIPHQIIVPRGVVYNSVVVKVKEE